MIVVLARPFQVDCRVRPDLIDSNHTRTDPMSNAFADQDNYQGDRKMFCDFRCRTDFPVPGEKPAQGCKQRHSPSDSAHDRSGPSEQRNDQHEAKTHNESRYEIGYRSNKGVLLLETF